MPAKSTPERYGTVAIAIHWVTALAVFALLASGFRAAGMTDLGAKASLLRVHVVLGLSVLVLTVLRLAWWVLVDRKPVDPAGTPRWQALAAHAVHGLFYVVIAGMAASGIGMIALSGAGDVLFGGSTAALPDFTLFLPRGPHGLGASVLVVLIIAHVAAALYHQFVLRDGLLARMRPGR